MTRRPFDYRAFRDGWRALASAHGLDPATGNPAACADPRWWVNPALWIDPGPAASCVERDAISSIAAQARALHGLAQPRTLEAAMAAEFRQIVREALEDDWRERRKLLPLRELHALRGVTVIDIEGQRLEVPVKAA